MTGAEVATRDPRPALLKELNTSREPDLLPVRHGRMMASPFTFYRGRGQDHGGGPKGTPVAGLDAQLSGDAHLSNFGAFALPERRLLLDVSDFDETLPGKRRHRGLLSRPQQMSAVHKWRQRTAGGRGQRHRTGPPDDAGKMEIT